GKGRHDSQGCARAAGGLPGHGAVDHDHRAPRLRRRRRGTRQRAGAQSALRVALGRLGLAAAGRRHRGRLQARARRRARPRGPAEGDRGAAERLPQPVSYRGGVQHRGNHRPARHAAAADRLDRARLRQRSHAPGSKDPGHASLRSSMRSRSMIVALGVLALASLAAAADQVVIEDWKSQTLGSTGLPAGWQPQNWGTPKYDLLNVVEDEGRRALHMKSANDSSTLNKDIRGKVRLKETPILEWDWKSIVLPKAGNSCKKSTDDQAGQVFVVWPRFPEAVRSRIIGY